MFSRTEIQQFSVMPTPFYHYDLGLLRQTASILSEEAGRYGYLVHYALKANPEDEILSVIRAAGIGADCVSGNEVKKALEYGFPAGSIVFAGVGKSDHEINLAIDGGIACFNCESVAEMEVINALAAKRQKNINIALRINPNVNARTHHYITTGLEENKFGINAWELDDVIMAMDSLPNLRLTGLHFHIGSQITDLTVFRGLCLRVNEIQEWFSDRHFTPCHINVGGGLGIDYDNPDMNPIPGFSSFFKVFNDFLELRPGQKLHFELGRAVVGQCGSLITRVLYVKKGINTSFIILDAGITELIRPALYQAYHRIENLTSTETEEARYDVVGPICESSDCFGKSLLLPVTRRGDIFAIRSAGAYGQAMASQYNLRDLVKGHYTGG